MGRGRAKAKQTRVARDLKYNTQFTDFDALQRELGADHDGSHHHGAGGSGGVPDELSDDVEDDERGGERDDDYDDWANARR